MTSLLTPRVAPSPAVASDPSGWKGVQKRLRAGKALILDLAWPHYSTVADLEISLFGSFCGSLRPLPSLEIPYIPFLEARKCLSVHQSCIAAHTNPSRTTPLPASKTTPHAHSSHRDSRTYRLLQQAPSSLHCELSKSAPRHGSYGSPFLWLSVRDEHLPSPWERGTHCTPRALPEVPCANF